MKNYNYLIALGIFNLIFTNGLKAQSGWYFQNPKSSGNVLKSSSFVDKNTGLAVGITVDGVLNWGMQDSGRTDGLSSISFINENIGTAVGEDGTILHTTNGGVIYVGIEASHSSPSGFSLSQNYPNPIQRMHNHLLAIAL